MTIISELLEGFKNSDLSEKVQIICDRIEKQETEDVYEKYKPDGVNVFLCLNIPPLLKGEISFLCLEREFKDQFIISTWTGYLTKIKAGSERVKRVKIIQVKEEEAEKILKEYAEVLIHYKKRK